MQFFTTLKAKLAHRSGRKKGLGQADRVSRAEDERVAASDLPREKNLVVASMESRFTNEMADYALEMAERMDYGIIAVNAANLTHDMTEFFSTSHEDLFQDFKETAVRYVADFRQKAEAKGLRFTHLTKYTDIDRAIEEISQEYGQIEFIITENRETADVRDSAVNDNRIAQRLFVYSLD